MENKLLELWNLTLWVVVLMFAYNKVLLFIQTKRGVIKKGKSVCQLTDKLKFYRGILDDLPAHSNSAALIRSKVNKINLKLIKIYDHGK